MNLKILYFYIIIVISTFACLDIVEKVERKKKKPENIKASLPKSPSLKKQNFIEKYSDGSYSVWGVISNIKSLLGKEISVKGFVYSMNLCPKGAEDCNPPAHFYIVDDLTSPDKKLMVIAPSEYIKTNYKERGGYKFKGKIFYWTPDERIVNLEGILNIEVTSQ